MGLLIGIIVGAIAGSVWAFLGCVKIIEEYFMTQGYTKTSARKKTELLLMGKLKR